MHAHGLYEQICGSVCSHLYIHASISIRTNWLCGNITCNTKQICLCVYVHVCICMRVCVNKNANWYAKKVGVLLGACLFVFLDFRVYINASIFYFYQKLFSSLLMNLVSLMSFHSLTNRNSKKQTVSAP